MLSECREWKLTAVALKSSKERELPFNAANLHNDRAEAGKPGPEPEAAELRAFLTPQCPGSTAGHGQVLTKLRPLDLAGKTKGRRVLHR
jgi:hypothetical protein